MFAAPRSKFNICDLSDAALDALFDMISSRYDLMLIDLPVTAFSWTADVVANCDAVLVTGINTISSLVRFLKRYPPFDSTAAMPVRWRSLSIAASAAYWAGLLGANMSSLYCRKKRCSLLVITPLHS